VETPSETPVSKDRPSGTTITVSPISDGRQVPTGKQLDELVKKLGYIYTPALKEGRQIRIIVNGVERLLTPWEMPDFIADSIIEREIVVGGKRAKIRAGIVAPGLANNYP